MAGIDGYFGPQLTDDDMDDYRFNPYARKVPRPNAIDLQRFPTNLQPQQILTPNSVEDDDSLQRYVGVGIGLATLVTENVLCHPFVVLRRQCQVNHSSHKFHLFPFTLVPVIIHLHHGQGITTLWKGIGSVLVVRGMTLAIEDLLSKVSSLPKEISWSKDSFKTIGQHMLLKCITLIIITPFYSASLVETVQSGIASEKPGVFDVFREGIYRLVSFGSPQKGRMLPVWTLVTPTVLHGMFKYLSSTLVKHTSTNLMLINYRNTFRKNGAFPKELSTNVKQEMDLTAQLISVIVAEVLFYPLETILHRLHLQGTRTIIDNLDNGFAVTSILTSYEGMTDCYDTALSQEGGMGLFKGFGALIVQFSVHFAVMKLTKFALTHLSLFLKSESPPRPFPMMPQSVPPPSYQLSQSTPVDIPYQHHPATPNSIPTPTR